jgi:hypothetical protein
LSTESRDYGAFGLRIRGIAHELLATIPTEAEWPELKVSRTLTEPPERPEQIGRRTADVSLLCGDRAVMRRDARTATLLTPTAADDGTLVHPFLTAAAVVFAWWDGRHAFHGGAFVDSATRAWCLLGHRASGKSSTLARISLAGLGVLSDDLVVIEGRDVLAGPRCVDLRPDAAAALGLAVRASSVRGGERLRLALAPVPAAAPLHGWLFLTWGDAVTLRRLRPSEWLERLAQHRSTSSAHAPSLLGLAGLPAWELCRPRTSDSLEPAVERLLDLVRS